MGKWMVAGVLAAAAVAAEGPVAPAPEGGAGLERTLFFATLEGLVEEGLPDEAVKAVLQTDAEGRYRHFVYACPVCMPVVEGFRAYDMRKKWTYARKGDPFVRREEDGAAWVRDPAAALHEFVGRAVERHVRTRRLDAAETAELRRRLAEGRKKGMSLLNSSEGFDHKSCPSCDGGAGTAWDRRK